MAIMQAISFGQRAEVESVSVGIVIGG